MSNRRLGQTGIISTNNTLIHNIPFEFDRKKKKNKLSHWLKYTNVIIFLT